MLGLKLRRDLPPTRDSYSIIAIAVALTIKEVTYSKVSQLTIAKEQQQVLSFIFWGIKY